MVVGRLQQTEQARGPILLVDDEPYILRSLSYLLTREGYAVETASNGEEGLERLRMVHPPLVFLDIMMPRMNGYEVCEQIKQDPALATTYVIMLSAKGQQIDRERAMLGGADEYMTKPFSPREVAERVHTLLATLDAGEPARLGPERGERIESR
jgi:DNA-binding response OmpR family regulator